MIHDFEREQKRRTYGLFRMFVLNIYEKGGRLSVLMGHGLMRKQYGTQAAELLATCG